MSQQNINTKQNIKLEKQTIDVNNHMHNLNYVDLANEALPEDVYKKAQLNNLRITYKKEIKLGETVKCKYSFADGKHFVVVKVKMISQFTH